MLPLWFCASRLLLLSRNFWSDGSYAPPFLHSCPLFSVLSSSLWGEGRQLTCSAYMASDWTILWEKKADWLLKLAFWNAILCMKQWQAVVFPLSLTCLMYAGSLVFKSLLLVDSWKEHMHLGEGNSLNCIKDILQNFLAGLSSTASNILAWRTFVVAPITEELVFRACMIPLLLCGGFEIYVVILLCPIIFSLAHLHHWMEIYGRQNYSLLKAFMVVGLQLGYTLIFGSYASFLFIRTGHLVAPLVAHIFCNFMGLPKLFVRRTGMVSLAFIAGTVAFICLLCPVTQPHLYNDGTNDCECWHGYCSSNLNSKCWKKMGVTFSACRWD